MKKRLFFICICLVLLTVFTTGLFAQEGEDIPVDDPAGEDIPDEELEQNDDRVPLEDMPLDEETEPEEEPAQEPAEVVEARVDPMQVFLAPGKFFLGLNFGGNIPLAYFGAQMDFGYTFGANLTYRISEIVSVRIQAGMVGIPSGDDDSSIGDYSLAGSACATLPLGGIFYGWLGLGVSARTPDFNDFVIGYVVTACAGLILDEETAVELGVEYNSSYEFTDIYLHIFLGAKLKL